jgi:hypothetical protein
MGIFASVGGKIFGPVRERYRGAGLFGPAVMIPCYTNLENTL